jgi:predicted ABC-type ATPase
MIIFYILIQNVKMIKHFYLLIGFPGSGKSSYTQTLIDKFGKDNVEVLCRDKIVCEAAVELGNNKARIYGHNLIVDKLIKFERDHIVHGKLSSKAWSL